MLSEISCLRVLEFLHECIHEFLPVHVRGLHPILESPTLVPTVILHEIKFTITMTKNFLPKIEGARHGLCF
jgi:hypothetical protein